MIGFISVFSSALAVTILLVVTALIMFIQSILPTYGLIKIDSNQYRYIIDGEFANHVNLGHMLMNLEEIGIINKVKSMTPGCEYGFNIEDRKSKEIATFNYFAVNEFIEDKFKIKEIGNESNIQKLNSCYIDIEVERKNE